MVLVVGVVQLALFPISANADQWTPTMPSVNATQVAVVVGDQINNQTASSLESATIGANFSSSNLVLCTAGNLSSACEGSVPGDAVGGTVLLPVCASATQTNCIATLSIGASAATLTPATYIRSTQGPISPAIPSLGIPQGSSISLWQSSVANASGTNTYAVNVSLLYDMLSRNPLIPTVSALIEPYSVVSGWFSAPNPTVITTSTGATTFALQGMDTNCAWTEAGVCGAKQDFAPGTYASMTIRVSNEISGWFFGRLQTPSLSVEPFDQSSQLLSVTGEAVSVPELEATSPFPQLSSAFQSFYSNQTFFQPLAGGTLETIAADTSPAFTAVDDFRSSVNNTASGVVTGWSFNSLAASGNSCLTSSSTILGLVTTNAMAYDGSAPTFVNEFLQYHVAGMHYLPDGSVASGTYDMIMADSVARCLYGFTNAPISATIAVTENSGVENVATTSVSDTGGWLHLGAYNFNFSDPVITMQLKQAPVAKVKKPIALTCVKGSSKRIVRGMRPRCPTGYQVHR